MARPDPTNPPAWRVTVEGEDRTVAIRPWLRSLTVADRIGISADRATIVLAAPADFQLTDSPRWQGASIRVDMGYADPGPVALGEFGLDTITIAGDPLTTTLVARSSFAATPDARRTLRGTVPPDIGVRTEVNGRTVEDVLRDVAGALDMDYQRRAGRSADWRNVDLGWPDYTNWQWGTVLETIAKAARTYVQIYDRTIHLVSYQRTIGTRAFPRADCSTWSVAIRGSGQARRACCRWYNFEGAGVECVGSGEPAVTLDELAWNAQAARERAQAAWDQSRAQAAGTMLSATLPGDPAFRPGVVLALDDAFPESIQPRQWRIVESTHRFGTSAGFTTSLRAETPLLSELE